MCFGLDMTQKFYNITSSHFLVSTLRIKVSNRLSEIRSRGSIRSAVAFFSVVILSFRMSAQDFCNKAFFKSTASDYIGAELDMLSRTCRLLSYALRG